MKFKLFSDDIMPACKYCENSSASKDMKTIICIKRGTVEPDFSCRAYLYAPLKRIPKPPLVLPIYDKKDFQL